MEEYILNFFKELNLQRLGIDYMCPTSAKFTSLKVLDLSFNKITKIENIPQTLEELYLNGNNIDHLSLNRPVSTLYHLGINRNKIRQTALAQIVKNFPNLICLDASFNDLCELDACVNWLKQLPELRMLSMEGNPLFLTPNYRKIIVAQMYYIKVLESIAIPADFRRAAEQAAKEREQKYLAAVNTGPLTPILNTTKIDFNLRILRQIKGARYLIPDENCNFDAEKLDSIPEEFKSSVYWLSYTDHRGKEVKSEKKIYIRNFQVVDESEPPTTKNAEAPPASKTGKSDFNHCISIDEVPSIHLRDWLLNDVVITLWESRPMLHKVKEEGQEHEVDRVLIDPKTELPKTETLNRGVSYHPFLTPAFCSL